MPDIAGNSLGTATSLNLTSNVQTFPDIVTSTANDYYRFTLSHRSSFNLSLANLSADANVALLSNTGSLLSVNGVLQTSNNTGNLAESINTTLDVGTYYIRVAVGSAAANATYSLNVSASENLKTDILWRNYSTGQNVVWQMNGTTLSTGIFTTPVADPNWAINGAGDFNNDGQTDILWRNYSTGQNVIWLMNGTTLSTGIFTTPVADVNWKIGGVGDFNNDGQADIVWRNNSTGQNVIWLMNGTTLSTSIFTTPVADPKWAINGVGDFNGDGKADILWRNYSTGQNVIWEMNGTTLSTGIFTTPVTDTNWVISGAGDFNQDGQTDILWRDYGTGQNVVWLMNGTTLSTSIFTTSVTDTNWRSLAPFIRTVEPTPISVAGNALATAFNLGNNVTGSGTYRNTVSDLTSDYYQFNLSTPSAVSLTLTGLTDNLDVQLVSSSNQVLQSSTLGNTSAEAINGTLNAGTYYVRVYAANGGSSAYALNLLVNNLPVVVTNAGLTLDEGTTTSISSSLLQVTDNDNSISQLTYTLGSLPGHGALSLNGAAIGAGTTFTQVDINTNKLRYQHDGSETLTDSFSFTVSDPAGGAIASNTFNIVVNPVNDAPVLTVPGKQSVDQNANSLIAGISLADLDAGTGNETITIAVANGLISLGLTTGLTFAQGTGSPATSITASGTLSALNNALTSLIYRSNASFQGTDTISLLVNDNGNTGKGGALTDSKTIAVTVNPVNKPPTITLPAAQSVNEDTSLSLAGISIGDVDAGGGNETVSLSAINGVLSLGATAGLTFLTGTGAKDRNVTISGTLALINAALSSLTYQGDRDFNGSDVVTVSVNDNGNTGNGVALSDKKSLLVTVTPVNDAPVLSVPAAQVANENTTVHVTGISISDVDAGSGAIAISLTATNGKLSLGSTTGLSFTSGNGSPNASLIFSGTLAAVNSALSTLLYQGNANFSGADAISINVNDNGNTGFGIPLSDSKTIAVTVLGVNQAPVIQVPLAPSTTANTNLTIAGVSISDPDAAGANETVTIAAANGVLSLPSSTGLTFLQGTGTQNNRLTFRGTLAAINTAIGNLVYRSYPGFTGFDAIAISVNDEGNTGIGTALSDTRTLFVNVGGAVNTPPTANPDSYSTIRNTALTIAGQGVLTNDTDPENNALTANLLTTPTSGTVVFNNNGTFIYIPNTNYVGSDSFTYRASDGIGNSSPATVNLSVTAPANQAPTAVADSFTLSRNSTFTTGNVLTNDSDPDGNTPLTAQIVANPTQASSFTLNSNGTFTYIPTTSFTGNDSFTYVARDALGANSTTATVNLSVTAPANQAPTAVTDSFTLSRNSTFTTGNVLTNDSDPDGNTPLTAQIVANPTQASSFTLNSNGTFTYIPTTSFTGNDSFTYVARDALGANSTTATVNLSVTAPANQAPTAVTDAFTLSRNSTFTTGNVLTNDSDPDGNTPLTAQIVANPTQASSFTLNSNGTFTYIPTNNFTGTDSFTYIARDALGANSTTATVNLSVTAPANQAPTAVTDAFTLSRNSTFTTGNVLTNDSDPDGNTPLTAQIVANPTQASSFTLNSNGTFTYIPTNNFTGNDSFTYVARDALGANSTTATVNLSVTAPANQAPTAVTDAFTLSRNSTFTTGNVLTNDSDPDGNTPLTAQIVANPTQASSFTLNSNGTFTYIPTNNFTGNDSFTYVAQDALGAASTTATVNLSITVPGNQAPTAVADSFTLSRNSTFTTGNVLTNDSDPDGNVPLTAQLGVAPTQGSLTLNSNGTFTYIPTNNFTGTDSFTYIARDALGANSTTATVNLSVTAPVNQAPTAVTDAFTLSRNSTFTTGNVLANDSDPDGNVPLTAQLGVAPTQGSLTLNSNGTFTYIPTNNFTGTDSFTYIARDALGAASTTATVNLSITAPVNQAPTAVADSFTLSRNSTLTTGNVLTNDSDPDNNTPLTAQIVANPTQASSFTLNSNGTFTYIPTTNFTGNDSFTYVAQDALGAASTTATVNLSVTAPANQAPTAVADSFTLSRNSTLTTGNVLTNDSDPDNNTPLTAQIVANPTQASSFTLNSNGTFTYIPTTNFTGNDSFTYVAQDALGAASTTATVNLSVTAPANQAPTAVADSFTLSRNSTLTTGNVLTNDSDPDGNTPLTAQIVANPTQASSFTLNSNGTFTYIPTNNFTGNDSFTYVAQDALGAASTTATVNLSITAPANQAPTAVADSFTLSRNSTLTTGNVLTNDSDPDGNTPLTAQIVANPTQASSFTLNSNGTFTYIPTNNFTGNDSFTYVAQDALGAASTTATVNLSITAPANQAPIAAGDTFRAVTNTPLTVSAANGVLKNDTDVDSLTLTALLVGAPGSGSVTLNGNGAFVYTPIANFNGTDTFTYKANDGNSDSNLATVTLSVSGNTAPTATPDTYAVATGVPLTVTPFSGVLQNDSDAEGDTLTASLLTPSSGSLTLNGDGSFIYTPNAGVTSGTDTFVYRVSDGFLSSSPATVTLSIGTNAAPIAQNDTYTASAGTTLSVNSFSGVLSNDTDAQPLTASVVSNPSQGTLILNGNGSFSYVPNASFTSGTDTFVYQASDGSLATSATVTLSVSVATAPIARNDAYQVVAGTTLNIGQTSGVLNNDSNTSGTLTAQLFSAPSQGTVALSGDGSFTYTPNAGVTSAIDTFVYQANNGVPSSPATVTLTIVSNARPVVTNDSYAVDTNSPLTINPKGVLTNDTDSDVGQTLSALLVSQPTHGSLLLRVDGSFVYTPDQGYLGADTFTYRANDGLQDSTSLGTVSLAIAANTAPIANPDTYSVNKNNILVKDAANGVLKNDTDVGPLTASVVNAPTQGSLALNSDGSFTYTPNAGVTNTTDTFAYKASDGSLSTNATVTVTIKDTSAPPTAVSDTGYTVNANGALTVAAAAGVLTNDTDPDGDVLKAISGTAPSHGTVTLNNDGSFVYTPTAGYVGADSFTYFANDGIGNSTSPATVSIVVGGVNSPPTIAVPGNQVVFRNTDLVIQSGLSVGDSDAGSSPVDVTLTAASGNLTLSTTSNLTVSGNSSQTVTLSGSLANINPALTNLVYRPVTAGFTGTDQIAIAVNDNGNTGTGGAKTTNATINVNVTNGPTLVKDLNPTQNATATGTNSSTPTNLTAANGVLFFSANDGTSGVELWRSDGTDTGTSLVADLNTTPDTSGSSNPGNLTVIGNTLYFTANNSFRGTELWKADLTGSAAPSIVKDIKSGSGSSNPRNLVNLNGTLYFEADDGSGLVLWKTDGTTANTVKVETTPGYSQPGLLVAAGNTLYFTAGNGNQLWRINAAGTQTTLLQDIGSGAGISNLVTSGNTLFFTASDSSNGTELWRSDGTAAGTTRISDINAGVGDANPSSLVNLNGMLYFFAKNGSNVYQLWQSTASGALSPASAALPSTGQAPTSLTVVGSKLFFVVDGGTSTTPDLQLWQSSGSGASLVKAINSSGNDAVASLTNVNGSLFFTANDGSTRIWKSDGTDAGTVSVSANFTGITPHNLTAVGNSLFFTAETTTTVLVAADPNAPTNTTQITGTTGEELFVL